MKPQIFTLVISVMVRVAFSQSLSDGLLLYYPCDGDATDISGNGFNGASTASAVEDRLGNADAALSFDGIDEYVSIPADEMLKPELPVTISFWANFSAFPDPSVGWGIFTNDDIQDQYSGIFVNINSTGTIGLNYCDGGSIGADSRRTIATDDAQELNAWHHYVFIVNGPVDMQLYVDCDQPETTYSGSGGALSYSGEPGALGRRDNSAFPYGYFKGMLDEVAFWNRALSADEVTSLCEGAVITGIKTIEEPSGIKVYPTLVRDNLTVEMKSGALAIISVVNINGEIIYEETSDAAQTNINMSSIPAGMYAVHVRTGDTMSSVKIVKE